MDVKEIDWFQIRVDFSITDSAHRWVFVTNDLVLQSQWKYVADSGFHTLSSVVLDLQAHTRGVFPPWQGHTAELEREDRLQRWIQGKVRLL